mgnify:CR=1 FL=1
MKYNVDSIKVSETKEVDISEYIPSATEPVKIKIKHLTTKKRNEVIALMMKGQELSSPDIRAGIALVIAAMIAHGTSIIDRAELIDRGYEQIDKRFSAIGAKIERIN